MQHEIVQEMATLKADLQTVTDARDRQEGRLNGQDQQIRVHEVTLT